MEVVSVGTDGKIHKTFPSHKHGYWELLLNTVGCGIITIEGEEFEFAEGDVFIIPPETTHSKSSKEGFTDISMFLKDFRQIGDDDVRKFHDDENRSIFKAFELAQFSINEYEMVGQTIGNVMGDLVYHILAGIYKKTMMKDMRVEHVVGQMHHHISDRFFDLSKTIEKCGYSEGYFRRMFKSLMGASPHAYFNSLRINRAKELLQQYGSSRTIQDIAFECGFNDPLYFSRMFKKITGMSPKEYIVESRRIDRGKISG